MPERLLGAMAPAPMAEWLPQITNQVLSRQILAVRRAIRIEPLGATAFSISFSCSEPYRAQLVLASLVTRFVEQNIREERAQWENAHEPAEVRRILDAKMGAALEIIDAASLPETPVSPNRLVVAAIGLVLGLIAGAIRFSGMWAIRHRPA